jgi:MoxR-like ATPase
MEEGQVTVDGVTYPLPRPFTLIATQNPTGAAGTQLLPDSQMDRFTVRLSVGYPKPKDERDMVLARQGGVNPLHTVRQVVSRTELAAMQEAVKQVYVKDTVVNYAVSLVAATRNHPQIQRGASPRATLALVAMARAAAFMNGRDYVIPDDVQTVFAGTVAHRLLLTADAQAQGIREEQLLTGLLKQIPAPGV